VGITSVYVTHDQAEAMVISDQIIVMNHGRIQQQGDARAIYTCPANRFVAEFIGLANLLSGVATAPDGPDGLLRAEIALGPGRQAVLRAPQPGGAAAPGTRVLVSIRPEDVEIGPLDSAGGKNRWEGAVTSAVYMGTHVDYQVDVGTVRIRVQATASTSYRQGARVAPHLPVAACVCIPGEPAQA
jgi:iron(III) transport system ATP-binding protein